MGDYVIGLTVGQLLAVFVVGHILGALAVKVLTALGHAISWTEERR